MTQEIKAAVHRLNAAPTAKESHCSGSAHTGISKTHCSSLQGEIEAKIAQCEMVFIQDEREHTGHALPLYCQLFIPGNLVQVTASELWAMVVNTASFIPTTSSETGGLKWNLSICIPISINVQKWNKSL